MADLVAYVRAGDNLYIHCGDGNGRTGTVAAVLLGVLYALSGSEALERTQLYRTTRKGIQGECPESHPQKMQVHRLLQDSSFRAAIKGIDARSSCDPTLRVALDVSVLQERLRATLSARGAKVNITQIAHEAFSMSLPHAAKYVPFPRYPFLFCNAPRAGHRWTWARLPRSR